MIICSCNVISGHDVRDIVGSADIELSSTAQIYGCLGCAVQCGLCSRSVRRILEEGPSHYPKIQIERPFPSLRSSDSLVQYPKLRRACRRPVPRGLCAVSRRCEGCRSEGKVEFSSRSRVSRRSQKLTLYFNMIWRRGSQSIPVEK